MKRDDSTHAVTLRLPLEVYEHLVRKANIEDRKFAPFMIKMLTVQMDTEKEAAEKS